MNPTGTTPSRPSSAASVWSTMESLTSPEARTESLLEDPASLRHSTQEEEPPVAGPSGITRKSLADRTPTTPVGNINNSNCKIAYQNIF